MNENKRPEIISKLSFYLMDKEPLIYLFIINSDFIKDEWGLLKQGDKEGLAGVSYKNSRVKFVYTDSFLALPLKELYFVLIHEAQHVFKHHTKGLHDKLENHTLVNIAEDSIINSEILEMKFLGLQPEMPDSGGFKIPDGFKAKFSGIGKDAYTTPRLYNWMKQKEDKSKEEEKRDFLKKNEYCKTSDGEYGKVLWDDRSNGLYTVIFESKEDMIKNNKEGSGGKIKEEKDIQPENLTPVIFLDNESGYTSGFENTFEAEAIGYFDKNINDAEELKDDKEEDIIPQNIFTENMVKQAEKMVESNPALQAARKQAGIDAGNSLIGAIKELLKTQVSWKKEFKQDLNIFMSDRGSTVGFKKSYITHLMNPRSRYGMLGKHKLRTNTKEQNYIIVAIDTSGSCFYDEYDKKRFFTEIDEVAKEMEFSNSGKVYTLMWDWRIRDDDLKEYKVGDWKRYVLSGGGGTNPYAVFEHLKSRTKEVGSGLVMKLNNKENIIIKNKKKLPYLLFLTDGYFYRGLRIEDFLLYREDPKSVMFLTRTQDSIPKGIKSIVYK